METVLENKDRLIANERTDIPGWGHDADPKDKPNYPMKKWNGADHDRLNYERGPQQPVDIEVLHSNERPSMTTVFGTSSPPSGVSGALRRYAFKYSEGSAAHWMTLILADRINSVEGIVDDIKHGYFPNFIKERGWTAEWKYNRKSLVTKLVVGAAVTGLLVGFAIRQQRRNRIPEAY